MFILQLEREDEWTERDGANFNGGASVESPDPDRGISFNISHLFFKKLGLTLIYYMKRSVNCRIETPEDGYNCNQQG